MSQWLHLPQDQHSNDKVDHLWWIFNPNKPYGPPEETFFIQTEDGFNILTEDGFNILLENAP